MTDSPIAGRYLVRSCASGADVWIAIEIDGQLYCYLPASGNFHYNRGLTADWLWDRDLEYEPITAARARALTSEGAIGALNPVTDSSLMASLLAASSLTRSQLRDVLLSD